MKNLVAENCNTIVLLGLLICLVLSMTYCNLNYENKPVDNTIQSVLPPPEWQIELNTSVCRTQSSWFFFQTKGVQSYTLWIQFDQRVGGQIAVYDPPPSIIPSLTDIKSEEGGDTRLTSARYVKNSSTPLRKAPVGPVNQIKIDLPFTDTGAYLVLVELAENNASYCTWINIKKQGSL